MSFKKISCLALAVMLTAAVCGCGNKGVVILPAAYDSQTQYDFADAAQDITVGDYTLSFDEKLGFPIFSGGDSGKKWDSSLGGNIAASALFIKLYDPTYESFVTVKSVDAAGEGRVKFEPVTNGARITYYFDEYEVSVPVYYTVNEQGLKIRIDPKEIDEHDYTVMSVSVAPYLCSAANEKNANRYLFVPSGSGALMYTDYRGNERKPDRPCNWSYNGASCGFRDPLEQLRGLPRILVNALGNDKRRGRRSLGSHNGLFYGRLGSDHNSIYRRRPMV